MTILYLNFDIAVDRLFLFTFGPFHYQDVVGTYRNRYSFGERNRLFTYTRHTK